MLCDTVHESYQRPLCATQFIPYLEKCKLTLVNAHDLGAESCQVKRLPSAMNRSNEAACPPRGFLPSR